MVKPDEDKPVDRKRRRQELENRIGSSESGYKWLQRINELGKNVTGVRKESGKR